MKFSLLAIAALPALALAQESFDTTSTITTTMLKTKTIKLSLATSGTASVPAVSNGTGSPGSHSTAAAPFPTGTGSGPFTKPTGTGVASHSFKPTVVPSGSSPIVTKGPESAGMSLEAGRVVLGGVAAMLVVAML